MPVYFPFAQPVVPASAKRNTDDLKYPSAGVFTEGHWTTRVSGGSVTVIGDSDNESLGRVRLAVTSAGNLAVFYNGSFAFPRNRFMLWQTNIVPSNLSDGTNTYEIRAGLLDQSLLDGAGYYFYYRHDVNAGKWTVRHDGVQVIATESFVNTSRNALRLYAFSVTGPVIAVVNDQIVGAIQSGVTMETPINNAIQVNKTLGAAARNFDVDYSGLYWTR